MSFEAQESNPGSRFFLKILASLLLLNGLTIAGLIYISYTFSQDALSRQAEDRIVQSLDQHAVSFDQRYSQHLARTLDIVENSSLFDELISTSSAEKLVLRRRIERHLIQLLHSHPHLVSARFFDADGEFSLGVREGRRWLVHETLNPVNGIESTPETELFTTLKETPMLLSSGNMEWFMPPRELKLKGPLQRQDGSYYLLGALAKLDKDTGEFGGMVVIEVCLRRLFEEFRGIAMFGHNPVWLLDRSGEVLLQPEQGATEVLDPRPFLKPVTQFKTRLIRDRLGLLAYQDLRIGLNEPPLRLVFSIPSSHLLKEQQPAFEFFSLVTGLSVLFMMVLSFFFSRYLANPVKELAIARNQLASAHRLAGLGYWEWQENTGRLSLSDNALSIFGRSQSGRDVSLAEFVGYASDSDQPHLAKLIRNAVDNHVPGSLDYKLESGPGGQRFVHQEIDIIGDSPVRVVGTIQDMTERRQAEARIRELAYHDVVTGLANRTLLRDLAETALKEAVEHGHLLAVIFLDLDQFKRINDTIGHESGDELLRQVARRLQASLRPSDTVRLTPPRAVSGHAVARLGGDEFIVLLPDLDHSSDAILVARRILDTLGKPFKISSTEVNTSASLGISFYPADGENVDELLQHADAAMYQAKANGRAQYAVYNSSLDENLRYRQMLESSLHQALEHDEFSLQYQPRVDVRTGRLLSVEALVRWRHPQQGTILPDSFIGVAEEIGLIAPIGIRVLEIACKQLAAWQKEFGEHMGVSINLSPSQFGARSLVDEVARVFRETGVDPGFVELEVTEQALFKDIDAAVKLARELKDVGVSLSIDDFGTGYSSLQQLKHLPVDTLKIDQSFVRDILVDTDDALIVRTSIELGHSLGLRVVGEGVEQAEQADVLREMGCDELQGFYFGNPASAEETTQYLRTEMSALKPDS